MKRLLLSVIAVLFSTVAVAGSFSSGGRSFGGGSSSSSARSMGMSRPATVPSTPTYSRPSYTAPAPKPSTTTSSVPSSTNNTTVIHHDSGGGGGGFMSSFGGSFLGSMLGSSIASHPVAAAPVVAGAPVAGGMATSGGAVVVEQGPSFGAMFLGFILILMAAGILGMLIYGFVSYFREQREEKQRMEKFQMMKGNLPLPFSPVSMFLGIQRAFASRDEAALRGYLGEDMIEQALADLPSEVRESKFVGVTYETREVNDNVISILFKATDAIDNIKVNEVWHFTKQQGRWVLNGINTA